MYYVIALVVIILLMVLGMRYILISIHNLAKSVVYVITETIRKWFKLLSVFKRNK